MRLFGHSHEASRPEAPPLDSDTVIKVGLYKELGALLEEAKTLPGFPGADYGAALGEYKTAGELVGFAKSATRSDDLQRTVDDFRATVERYRPKKTPEHPPVEV